MKYLFILFLLPAVAFSQTGTQLVEISKVYHKVEVPLTDGLVYKWKIGTQNDSARYFNPAGKQYEATVTFKEINAALTLKETINDTNARITYTGTWLKYANQPWTNGSCPGCVPFLNADVSLTYTVGSAASMTFTGKRISVVAEKRLNHGIVKIEVKQGNTVIDSQTIDTYTDTSVNAPNPIYSKDLPQGTYVVSVGLSSVTPTRNSFVLDSFLVHE